MATRTTSGKVSKPKETTVRKLDLHDQFTTHAKALVQAAKEGAKLHAAGNIAESGDPFEKTFRALFSYALPSPFLATAGYFFGHDFELSGQVDFLLCDQTDVLKLPPAAGLETGYVPYRSVKVMAQLKNSATDLKKALSQATDALRKWKEMANIYPSTTRKEPLSLIVIGRGGTDKALRSALENSKGVLPAYVLLLERGLLYGPRKTVGVVFDSDEAVYAGQGNGGPLVLLEAQPLPNDAGRLLMWLFFGVLHYVVDPGESTTLTRIVDRAQRLNPVAYSSSPEICQN